MSNGYDVFGLPRLLREFWIGTSIEAAAPVLAYSRRGGQIAALSPSVLCFGLIKNTQIKVEWTTVCWKSEE